MAVKISVVLFELFKTTKFESVKLFELASAVIFEFFQTTDVEMNPTTYAAPDAGLGLLIFC